MHEEGSVKSASSLQVSMHLATETNNEMGYDTNKTTP